MAILRDEFDRLDPRPKTDAALRTALSSRAQSAESVESLHAEIERRETWLRLLAHELGSPLMTLVAIAETLSFEDDASKLELADSIKEEVKYMKRVIQDSLRGLKLPREEERKRRSVFDLRSVIRDVRSSLDPLVRKRRMKLALRLATDEIWIDGDRTRIKQMLINLLTNALKYSPEGEEVQLVLMPDQVLGQVSIRVIDHGIGIEQAELKKIFRPFFRASKALHETGRSAGLGLALVEAIARAHDGEVSASSPGLGKGSVFTVRLPLSRRAPRE